MDTSFRRLAALGLLLYAASRVLIFIELAHDEEYASLPFLAVPFALALAIALVVDRYARWWASALTLVAGLLALGSDAPYAGHIAYFDRAWEFAPIALAIAGSVATVIFSATDLVQRRRRASTDAPAAVATAYGAVVAGVATLVVVSFAVTLSTVDSVDASERDGATLVEMAEWKFSPAELTATAGQPVKLVVENDDFSTHTFTLEAPGASVDEAFGAGDQRVVEFTVSEPGTYAFKCDLLDHTEMEGTVTVR